MEFILAGESVAAREQRDEALQLNREQAGCHARREGVFSGKRKALGNTPASSRQAFTQEGQLFTCVFRYWVIAAGWANLFLGGGPRAEDAVSCLALERSGGPAGTRGGAVLQSKASGPSRASRLAGGVAPLIGLFWP
jgi:hypothetical protein